MLKIYSFILDQKGPRQATFGGKGVKLVEKLKRRLSREEEFEDKRAYRLKSV